MCLMKAHRYAFQSFYMLGVANPTADSEPGSVAPLYGPVALPEIKPVSDVRSGTVYMTCKTR